MKATVTVYRDNDPVPFNKLHLSVEDVDYISELIDDIDCFLEEQFHEIKESDDE